MGSGRTATKVGRTRLLAMSSRPTWPRNRFLLALPSRDLKRLLPELERVPCEREQVLLDAEVLEDGRHFDRNDVGAMLLRLMEEKSGDESSVRR